MKNIEKFFVTVALFLATATWFLFLFVLARQSLDFFQQASISSITSGTPEIKSINGLVPVDSSVKSSSVITSDNSSESSTAGPSGKYAYPESGSTVSSKIEIKFEVADATAVEFYIRRAESSKELYLGYSTSPANNVWTYYWNSESTPNGTYYIIAYISGKYGRYAGERLYVTVNNQVKQQTDQVTQLKQEINNAESLIQNKETELNKAGDEINRTVSQKTDEISSDANSAVSGEQLSGIKKELNDLSLKIINNIGTSAKIEFDKLNQEISGKAKEVGDMIVNSAGDKEKAEEIRQKVGSLVIDSIGRLDQYFSDKQKLEEAERALALKDSDNDELSDQEELRIGSNPLNADSDGDGFLDGSEVKLGYDPLAASPADKINYQSPKEVQAPVSEDYKIEKAELVQSQTSKDEKVLKITGKAPANSFITIYIYSAPTIVVTKADENGNWEYTLDKPISDGRHTVYASVTNNKGDIEKVSQSFDFVKAEEKIIKFLTSAEGTTQSPSQNLNRMFVIMIAITVLLAVLFVILILGIYLKQHNK